ncbi:MAG: TetR/AcrR family transcriptional regulator [Chloroflexi bacterium]|nr:TetR/AcrR family transcriptional regulator [Chloroflexota bacterium]
MSSLITADRSGERHASSGRGRTGDQTLELILEKAEEMIHDKGFMAVSLRDLANAVGVRAASLYYHFPSKEDILFAITKRHMDGLLTATREALGAVTPEDVACRLETLLRTAVTYHVEHRYPAGVMVNEARNLKPEHHVVVRRLTKEYEAIFLELVRAGTRSGPLPATDHVMSAFAILGAITRLPIWYRPEGRLSPDQIADSYVALFLWPRQPAQLTEAALHQIVGADRVVSVFGRDPVEDIAECPREPGEVLSQDGEGSARVAPGPGHRR